MKTVPDYILVRSRWVMANKGDSAEPNMRARLVGCEVNNGGEKNDQFFASTPPLEANKILFSLFSSEKKTTSAWEAAEAFFCRHPEGVLQRSTNQESLYAIS